MNTVNIKLYDFIRKEFDLPDEKARAFAEVINEVISEDVKHEQPVFKSWYKNDFQRINDRINEMTIDISRLDTKISDFKTDIVRWMLVLFLGQMAVFVGMLMYFFGK